MLEHNLCYSTESQILCKLEIVNQHIGIYETNTYNIHVMHNNPWYGILCKNGPIFDGNQKSEPLSDQNVKEVGTELHMG